MAGPTAPGPASCSPPATGSTSSRTAERGLLDLVTIEDALACSRRRPVRPDERTDQVRGRLDAVLIASPGRPADPHIGLVPTRDHHPHRAVPRGVRRWPRSTTSAAAGPAGGPRSSRRPAEAAHFGRRAVPDRRRARRPSRRRRRRRPVRRGRRRRRGRAAAVGQLGGRRRDPRRGHRPVHRPRQAPLRSTSRASASRSRDRRSCPARPRASRPWSPLAHARGRLRVRRRVGRRRVRHPAWTRPTTGAIVAEVRAAEAAVGPDRTAAADPRRPRRAPRRRRAEAARPPGPPRRARRRAALGSDAARVRRHARRAGRPRRRRGGRRASTASGCGPAWPADRPRRRGRRPGARAPGPRRCTATAYGPGTLRDRLGLAPARPTATPPRRRPAGEPARKQIILAAHFPGVNNTTVWSDPRSGSQIDFVVVRAPGPHRRAGQVRLLLPRRGPPPARAAGPHPRPRRGRPARHPDRADGAGRRHRPPRPGRHAERHVPRALRAGPPAGHARPPLRRPGGVERGHLVRRVHRRELPPGRLPRPRTSATSGPASSSRPARTLWDSWAPDDAGRRPRRRPLRPPRRRRRVRPPRRPVRHRGPVQRAPQPAGPPGHHPGRRLRRRPRAGGAPTADAIFTRHARLEAGRAFYADVKRPARPLRPRARRASRSCPATTVVLGDTEAEAQERGPPRSAASRSARPPPSAARAGLEPRPVGLRPRRPAARRRPRRRRRHPSSRAGPRDVTRPARDRPALAGAGRGEGPGHPRPRHRRDRAAQAFVGHARARRRPRSTASCRPTRATASSSCPT